MKSVVFAIQCLLLLIVFSCSGTALRRFSLAPQVDLEQVQVETFPMLKKFEQIYMGGLEGAESDFSELANLGVKSVINLQLAGEKGFSPEDEQFEREQVEAQGMDYISFPLGAYLFAEQKIKNEDLKKLDQLIATRIKDGQIFLHCSSGMRTAFWLGWHLFHEKKFSVEASLDAAELAGLNRPEMKQTLKTLLEERRLN